MLKQNIYLQCKRRYCGLDVLMQKLHPGNHVVDVLVPYVQDDSTTIKTSSFHLKQFEILFLKIFYIRGVFNVKCWGKVTFKQYFVAVAVSSQRYVHRDACINLLKFLYLTKTFNNQKVYEHSKY